MEIVPMLFLVSRLAARHRVKEAEQNWKPTTATTNASSLPTSISPMVPSQVGFQIPTWPSWNGDSVING